ncbi:ribonuclease G [Candidatus Methylospira mobilis]|uniref:Ribonuclease G n=1 Tax=Candidatus Methylospira mobilis TaxID=1808979 RepID=A0A5Q0BHR4_9GAMM|nr:ribonuclease G [Candidatus Methylospira mobilis]QFY42662.1 ribonuclease G [Candidatus Methylospira mobilis]
MSDEILINITPPETRVAFVENGVLQEVLIERSRKRGLVGNIYKGRVCRVLPGMQAVFVEIGLERTAFLHVSDLNPADRVKAVGDEIERVFHESQEIVVQVLKDPIGSKGARLTTDIAIPSVYQVYMPFAKVNGISQRIECEKERARLRACIEAFQKDHATGGFIARTAAEGVDEAVLRGDMLFLQKIWHSIAQHIKTARVKTLLHEDLPLAMRVLRDLKRSRVEKIRVDSRETYMHMRKFAREFVPETSELIEHYAGERPLFDLYKVEEEIQLAIERKVSLKSGGYLIIDQTEAMTTIDVNTGAFVGGRNLEETIFKTNLEAAQAIAHQLRLRNLGGIIIIDFIDMLDSGHKELVLNALGKSLEKDHAKNTISGVSMLGLVEMTRKRTRESLEHVLCEPCPSCAGRGVLKTAETVCLEIFREIIREVRLYNVQNLLVLASNEVVERLLSEEADTLSALQAFLGVHVKFRAESQYNQEQYDVVLL